MPKNNALDRLDVPLRNAKATIEPLQKLNVEPVDVLDIARANARLEPKAIADELGISHSLALRGLKSGDLNFRRLWGLEDVFWTELVLAIVRKRRLADVTLKTTIEIARIA